MHFIKTCLKLSKRDKNLIKGESSEICRMIAYECINSSAVGHLDFTNLLTKTSNILLRYLQFFPIPLSVNDTIKLQL